MTSTIIHVDVQGTKHPADQTAKGNRHRKRKWKITVITHEEDLRLNKLKRETYSSPDKRWAAAKIEF